MRRLGVMAALAAVCVAASGAPGRAQDSLIPTREQAQLQRAAAMGRDLERSIASIPGVSSARVHIALPSGPAFADGVSEPTRASVLVSAVESGPQVDHEAVQRLVAGAVPRLDAAAVVVVEVPAAAPKHSAPTWTHVGPFVVADTSAPGLRGALAWLLAMQALLAVLLVRSVQRSRRTRSADADGGSP